MAKKSVEIYRDAADRLARERPTFACYKIDEAAGTWPYVSEERRRFNWYFHHPSRKKTARFGLPSKETKNLRILGVLLMAEIEKDL